MITMLLKQLRLSQFLPLMGVPFVIALVLLISTTAPHASAFSLLSLAHAMMLRPTCASTQGTQPNLCNQRNPLMQGCTQDAQTLEAVSVFTSQNALIGEVDLMHSTTCKAMWVRTIAFANAEQVQAIDASISFNDGKVQDHQARNAHSGQRLVALTDMSQPAISPKTLTGVFHLQGQRQPLIIPLQVPGLSALTQAIDTGKADVQGQSSCASHPSPQTCTDQDPVVQGCAQDAETIAFLNISDAQWHLLARLERRYSPRCHAEWGRILDDEKQPLQIIVNQHSRSTQGGIAYSTMVFVPNLSIAPQITGIVSVNSLAQVDQGPGQEAILPALPPAQTQ